MPTRDRRTYFLLPFATYEKSKYLDSDESIVARLKLKRIDGRTSPEVELAG